MRNTPFLLIINDGWGVSPKSRGNAIAQAKTPVFDHLIKNYWTATLQASGESVGLPWGEMGNSEVGHLSLGAGKIIYQDLPRITKAISDGSFFKNQEFLKAVEKIRKTKGALHIAGLVSDGGVHSHVEHLDALLEFAANNSVQNVLVHCFLDGRDVPYNSASGFIKDVQERIGQFNVNARIATIMGRYWSMDRDNRWDRIEKAYNAMVYGKSEKSFKDPIEAIEFYYKQNIFDEQIPPTTIEPKSVITNSDSLIFFNFRADRIRQITKAFVLPEFDKFKRREYLKDLLVVTMTEYDRDLPVGIAFPQEDIEMPLSKVLSDAGLRQLHIAETEKYAHVTFFFNGGNEEPYKGEDRILIPSPQVSSYDEVPEMSAFEIKTRLVREINTGKYDFLVVNFANADMVGHTGNYKATVRAVEVLDECMKDLVEAILSLNGVVLITADHGNAEVMFNPQTGEINKEHTSNPVPCIIVGRGFVQEKPFIPDLSAFTPKGVLADVSPTILKIMDIPIPAHMSGRPLI